MTALDDLARLRADLDRAGTSVMALARCGQPPEPWVLYPDEYGSSTGHFHTVRLFSDHTVHLVAISMAPTGWPQALFTLNLWAIGGSYASPENLSLGILREIRGLPTRSQDDS